jgi:16S rRNA processing protein RimM
LAVGRVLRPHGVRGELRVEVLTDYPERLAEVKTLYLGATFRPYELVAARLHKQFVLLKLRDCDDRDAADALRGVALYVAIEDAIPLEDGEVYEHQLEGVHVVTEDGTPLGEIVEVLSAPGANDVLVIHGARGELLVPVIEDVLLALDWDAAQLVIRPLPGLIDGL